MTRWDRKGRIGARWLAGIASLVAVMAGSQSWRLLDAPVDGAASGLVEPARAEPAPRAATARPIPDLPGNRLGFVATYFYFAMYQGSDACPTGMHHILTSQEYLAGKPPEERARLLLPQNKRELFRAMDRRGPKGENVCDAPWVLPDASLTMLSGDRNDGIDLDGWHGKGAPPPNICAQKQFIGENGEPGIDNQLGRIYACLNGTREKGTLTPYFTQTMRSGMWSMLIEVSGVQDPRNDPEVNVDIYAGAEPMVRDAIGAVVADASLSPLPDPKLHRRMRGRIVDGVVETTPVADLVFPDLMAKDRPRTQLFGARLRLTLQRDGNAKGLLGGYLSIDTLFSPGTTDSEQLSYMGYSCEGMYNSLRRYADGHRNPINGSCDQISTAYRIEAVPAFIVHPETVPVPSFKAMHR